jgi:hypothetical protein
LVTFIIVELVGQEDTLAPVPLKSAHIPSPHPAVISDVLHGEAIICGNTASGAHIDANNTAVIEIVNGICFSIYWSLVSNRNAAS